MTPERWQHIKDLLDKALPLNSGDRSSLLDQACSGDPLFRREVEALLAANDDVHPSFLRTSPLAPPGLTRGTRLGEYEIESLLGSGGMGEVYRAHDVRLNRPVAIKVLPAILSSSSERLRRFEQEARAAAALNHPNILAVYQLGDYQGAPYLVSELLEGGTLREEIRRGSMSPHKATESAIQVARGLAAAHEKGIVHRDLKPENIFIVKDGRVKILDFGLAKLIGRHDGSDDNAPTLDNETEPGVVLGTVGYMSPEQVRGQAIDHRTDIFAFGVILYEMLTGKRAFHAETKAETMAAILREEPQRISQIWPGTPPALQKIVQRCLEKNPERRFQSASDLAFGLETLSGSDSSRISAGTSLAKSRVPWRWLALCAVVSAAVITLILFATLGYRRDRFPGGTGKAMHSDEIHSLAVLPLQNLSGDAAQEYFADGMTEELTADLSKIGAVRVISRTSAMRYKGATKSLPEIARELNVDGIIEGSVQRSGNRVKVTAQLIHAPSDTHLWAESYERDLRDVLSLQDEVARDIANKVKVRLTPSEQALLSRSSMVDPQAYESYLEGRYYWNMRTVVGFNKGITYFRDAIEKDPHYGLAYAGLAQSYITLEGYRVMPSRQAFSQARAAALKALELDDRLAEGHTALAVVRADYDLDSRAAEKEFQRAIALSPNYATAHQWYAEEVLAPSGRSKEAIAEMKRALELDPLSIAINTWYGAVLYWAGQTDEAVSQLRKTIALDSSLPMTHLWLGRVYLDKKMFTEALEQLQDAANLSERQPFYLAALGDGYAAVGRASEAATILTELVRSSAHKYVPAYEVAALSARLGRTDQAFQWLGKACQEGVCPSMIWRIKSDSAFDKVRSDRRYSDLLRVTHVPQQ
jgi:TolB-like protein/Flp pilus assembly protein TadD